MWRRASGKGSAAAVGLASALGLGGCAASPMAAPATAPPAVNEPKEESREPATIEEAQAAFERARAQLAGGAAAGPGAAGKAVTTALEAGGTTSSTEPGPPPPCGNACNAMGSMRRAVEAICRLAGESDARCTDARRTMKDSEAKVVGCGCPPP